MTKPCGCTHTHYCDVHASQKEMLGRVFAGIVAKFTANVDAIMKRGEIEVESALMDARCGDVVPSKVVH